MKINEILCETTDNDISYLVKLIKDNCRPFLSQCSVPLWRGMTRAQNAGIRFRVVNTEINRKPRDTPFIIHNEVVDWFEQKSGIAYRQDNTLFATGSYYSASGYGIPFMVFPIGEFQYCWSPYTKDLTDTLNDYLGNSQLSSQEIKSQTETVLSTVCNYQFNTGLQAGAQSLHEIMIHCKSYYIFDFLQGQIPYNKDYILDFYKDTFLR